MRLPFGISPTQAPVMLPAMADAAGQAINYVQENPLQGAAIATTPVPVVGDVMGLLADADMYANDPESRNLLNYGLSALGVLPFVPNARGVVKGVTSDQVVGADEVSTKKLKDAVPMGGRLARTNYARPISEMSYKFKPTSNTPLLPFNEINPEFLQQGGNNVLIPLLGDRTLAGETLTSINGGLLNAPVNLQGGATYMRSPAQTLDNLVWASDKGVIKNLNKKINEAYGQGADNVYLAYTSMGGEGGDFSRMMSDAMFGQISGQTLPRKSAKEFDDEVKTFFPDWAGSLNPEVTEQLANMKGSTRARIIKLMGKAKYQKLGFPDIASTRFAITDPRLVHTPVNTVGLEIARAKPDAQIVMPSEMNFKHDTYPVGLIGDYVGGFQTPLPFELGLPSVSKTDVLTGRTQPQRQRSIGMNPTAEVIDQEFVDNAMGFLEQVMKNER